MQREQRGRGAERGGGGARLALSLALVLSALPAAAQERVYVSCANDREVQVFAPDAKGKLHTRAPLRGLAGKPGPMALSPDGARVYVATTRRVKRKPLHEILTLLRLADGSLKLEGQCAVDVRDTYLRAAPSGFLLTASYGAGNASVYALTKGLCARRVSRVRTERTAHCIELDPSGRFAFVPHTAPNKVYQFRFDPKQGALSDASPRFVDGPAEGQARHQPRHLRFHPTLPLAYSSNERGGGISSWRLDSVQGTLTREQTLSTLPAGYVGKSAAAEVRISPQGRFVYVSNRDIDKKGRDSLAGFAIDAQGALTPLGTFPTARIPRSFSLDAKGAFLYAAGQGDGQLACYRVESTGRLTELERIEVGRRPSWVLVAPLP